MLEEEHSDSDQELLVCLLSYDVCYRTINYQSGASVLISLFCLTDIYSGDLVPTGNFAALMALTWCSHLLAFADIMLHEKCCDLFLCLWRRTMWFVERFCWVLTGC